MTKLLVPKMYGRIRDPSIAMPKALNCGINFSLYGINYFIQRSPSRSSLRWPFFLFGQGGGYGRRLFAMPF